MGAVLTMTPRTDEAAEASRRIEQHSRNSSVPCAADKGKVLVLPGGWCPACESGGIAESHGRYSKSGRYEFVRAWCLRCDADFMRVYEVADADARAQRGGGVV